jgi:peroxiredoxin/DNA-binding transcriptional MerR regulator
VRYYESLGLITPDRSSNGYREYDDLHLRLVREVRVLRESGIPVESTRPFLDCLAAGHAHSDECPASLASYRDAINDLDRRISGLQQRRSLLIQHLEAAAHRTIPNATPPSGRRPARAQRDTRTRHMTDLNSLPADLPAPEDDGATAHLPGQPMPRLALPATAGDQVRLDRLDRGRTVLYLYPLTGRPGVDLPDGWDAIPGARGCTPQACAFRDHYQELLQVGAKAVYGLSSQDSDYQRELVDRLHLPFAMLSDTRLEVADALDLPTFTADGRRLYKRQTLIVSNGRIEHVFYPIFPPDQHAQQVLDWLTSTPAATAPNP